MGRSIAVTGKGGVGKTTVSALVMRALVDSRCSPILAIDADPNLNLDTALGVRAQEFLGSIREEALDRGENLPAGMTKVDFITYRTRQAVLETDDFDFLAMGRPEGPGCYCFANSVMRQAIDRLTQQYEYVVVDCEAGLEHFSRRTTGDIDVLLILTDPSLRSADTVFRVLDLVGSLKTRIGRALVAVTRTTDGIPPAILERAAAHRVEIAAAIPDDPELRQLDAAGRPLLGVSPGNPALAAVRGLLAQARVLPTASA
jgi:CO dehydrogenase maturation factor